MVLIVFVLFSLILFITAYFLLTVKDLEHYVLFSIAPLNESVMGALYGC